MYKLLVIPLFFLVCFCAQGQSTGTLKIAKPKVEKQRDPHLKHFFTSSMITFAGKSSPKAVRDFELKFGPRLYYKDRYATAISSGIIIGKSHPNVSYEGYSLGAFIHYDYRIALGASQIYLPVTEISYKRIFNSLEGRDLNQYSFGVGVSIYLPYQGIAGLHLTLMGHYRYDTNSIDTYKVFFPTIGVDYRF